MTTPRCEFPTQAKAGRLRLTRVGADLSYLVSEGPGDEFTLVHKESFGPREVRQVRVVAMTSGHTAALTVRVKDLRIRAEAFTRVAPALPKRSWRKPALLIVALMIVLPLGLWLGVRLRRGGKTATAAPAADGSPATAAPAPVENNETNPEGTASILSFPCPGCGKGLKTRSELAGKKVRCRHCGKVVQVPPARPGGPDSGRHRSIKPRAQ
jgi:hypothetical protein